MRLKILTSFLFLLPALLLSAQEMKLYAPFPSRIKAETSGRNIVITWKDSSDVQSGTYEIYRSEKALTADNLNFALKIGDASAGVQTYNDAAPLNKDFYYAVFVRDDKQVYKICIPYRNVTTSPVRVKESDVEETKSTVVSDLTVKTTGNEVSLSLTSSLKERNIILFRSTFPIDSYDKLIKSVIIDEEAGSAITYSDTPMPGLDYYYAAVDADLYRSGSTNLLYSGNHTLSPIHILFSHQIIDNNRYVKPPMPLPLLDISENLKSGAKLEDSKEDLLSEQISPKTLADVQKLLGTEKIPWERPPKATLAYNKNINSIVSGDFAESQWKECVDKLKPFITSRYDEETRDQSHFYLGQAYFFLGKYDQALLEFIMVEDNYYNETKPFFDAIYARKRSS